MQNAAKAKPGRTGKLLDRMRAVSEIRNLGFANWLIFKYHKKRKNRGIGSGPKKKLSSRFLAHPVYFREGTSDLYVFRQVLAEREYGCIDDCSGPKLIIDCGANVGYASAYFLSRFPSARVIAIEPDPGNFALLQENMAPYGQRVGMIQAGIWSHRTGLVITADSGPGQEWGRSVRPAGPGDKPAVQAIDIFSLLQETGQESISILKIDVEGSEAAIFSENFDSWINRVDNLIIELHGPECEKIFVRAIAGIPFAISRTKELTVCKKKVRKKNPDCS